MASAAKKNNAKPRKKGGSELSGFAYTDSKGTGHLPLRKNGKLDPNHVRNARARFNQTHFESPSAKSKALAKIKAAEKTLGIGQDKKHTKKAVTKAAAQVHAVKTATSARAINDADLVNGIPEWVMLIPAGKFSGRDGRGPFESINADKIIAETLKQKLDVGLPFDINHSTDFAAPNGGGSPAAGWIKELQNRNGEVWGRVEWTSRGKEALTKGPNGEPPEYRYLSPVFTFDEKTGEVEQLLRAALTNNPNLYDTAICAKEEEMRIKNKAKIVAAMKADAELVKAAKRVKGAMSMLGITDYAQISENAGQGSPVQKAFDILNKAAEQAGISIAHFLDAINDMAESQPESPDTIDENDMPDGGDDDSGDGDLSGGGTDPDSDQMDDAYGHMANEADEKKEEHARLKAAHKRLPVESIVANGAFAVRCAAMAKKAEKAGKAAMAEEFKKMESEAKERLASEEDTESRHDMDGGDEGDADMNRLQMAEHCETEARKHDEAGRSEDARKMRVMAKYHRDKHEEEAREAHRKDAESAVEEHVADLKEDVHSKISTLTKQLEASNRKVDSLSQNQLQTLAGQKVDEAIRNGKITPAQRDWAISRCVADPSDFETFLKNQPALVAGVDGRFELRNGGGEDFLSPAEKAICARTGVDPAKYLANRKANAQTQAKTDFVTFAVNI